MNANEMSEWMVTGNEWTESKLRKRLGWLIHCWLYLIETELKKFNSFHQIKNKPAKNESTTNNQAKTAWASEWTIRQSFNYVWFHSAINQLNQNLNFNQFQEFKLNAEIQSWMIEFAEISLIVD